MNELSNIADFGQITPGNSMKVRDLSSIVISGGNHVKLRPVGRH